MNSILGNPSEELLIHALIYGESQRKKSWWAAAAAEAGFGVLVLNGDKPATIYRQLSRSAQSRIRIVNVFNKYNFAYLVADLLRGGKVYWDIQESKKGIIGLLEKTHDHFLIDLSKMNKKIVVIVDSWTAIASCVVDRLAIERKIDLLRNHVMLHFRNRHERKNPSPLHCISSVKMVQALEALFRMNRTMNRGTDSRNHFEPIHTRHCNQRECTQLILHDRHC